MVEEPWGVDLRESWKKAESSGRESIYSPRRDCVKLRKKMMCSRSKASSYCCILEVSTEGANPAPQTLLHDLNPGIVHPTSGIVRKVEFGAQYKNRSNRTSISARFSVFEKN